MSAPCRLAKTQSGTSMRSTATSSRVSSSQIVANDLYRCTVVPRLRRPLDEATVDRTALMISRVATVVVMTICAFMAWILMDMNVALLVWIGIGGMMAAFAGPLVLGALWSGVTRAGALAGFGSGALVFAVAHAGLVDPEWFAPGSLRQAAVWLAAESDNPWSCAAMGELASVASTFGVSKFTRPLSAARLADLFGEGAP